MKRLLLTSILVLLATPPAASQRISPDSAFQVVLVPDPNPNHKDPFPSLVQIKHSNTDSVLTSFSWRGDAGDKRVPDERTHTLWSPDSKAVLIYVRDENYTSTWPLTWVKGEFTQGVLPNFKDHVEADLGPFEFCDRMRISPQAWLSAQEAVIIYGGRCELGDDLQWFSYRFVVSFAEAGSLSIVRWERLSE